jgi:hypothetical protein
VLLRRLCEDVQHVVNLVLDYPPQIGHSRDPEVVVAHPKRILVERQVFLVENLLQRGRQK